MYIFEILQINILQISRIILSKCVNIFVKLYLFNFLEFSGILLIILIANQKYD